MIWLVSTIDDRPQDGVWKIMGPLTLVGSIWVAIYKDYISPEIGFSLVFVILFWAINITIDYNQWHRRNLFFLTAVEREFFDEKDYGSLIPFKFKTPKPGWISFYKLCACAFWALIVLSLIMCFQKHQKCINFSILNLYDILIFLIGLFYTGKNYSDQEKSILNYRDELFINKNI